MPIDLYTWKTPNGRKVSIMLEELALPYETHTVNIGQDEQFAPDFLAISPNNKIPAIVDPEGPDGAPISLFETGAILLYLAEKTGRFMPRETRARQLANQWLMWQMGGFGPMLGQAHHFRRFAKEQVPYAIERYTNETRRLYGVLDRRLGEADYLAGEDYSVADIATYPWAARHEWHGMDLADFPNVKRWYDAIGARPAVERGMAVPA
ncbi:MAG: glutathione S-transferase N-terminal domain-containing protein [Kiloniellales bacterium]|nr:glutathione S-transferase N-terminal domain-containing protein [Kiloniellales bacterium]